MSLLHSLLYNAGRRLAADPKVREKAREAFETEIKPRAKKAAAEAKPRFDATRDDIHRIAAEAAPDDSSARVAGRATMRIWQEITGKRK